VRILCVDDDPEILAALADALEALGFEVARAGTGAKAIDAYLEGGADLVVLDLELPDMQGVDVCRAVKTLAGGSFLPVLFLTGHSDRATHIRVLDGGGDDYCTKPTSIEELAAHIRVLLRARNREQVLEHESGRYRRIALLDPLTELGNRRAFDQELEREWSHVERHGHALALLVADADRFKAVNDRHGHRAGDGILRNIARSIAGATRQGDSAFRQGGDEFALLLPETDLAGALVVAERIRADVALSGRKTTIPVTVSIGAAAAPGPGIHASLDLVEAADRALYEAKVAGRDRSVAATPHSVRP
jgi:diguanylate cyclase (GGDEF)-like protein